MGLFGFNFGSSSEDSTLESIFPIPISSANFIAIDLQNIYARILTDTLERTLGIPEGLENLLWDNCLAAEKQDGLVTLVAKAMVNKSELFIVYSKALKVITRANATEEAQIKADYKKNGESSIGIYVTFKNYDKTDMLKFYSSLEFCSVGGLWKQGNISNALQLKLKDLRSSTAATDSGDVKKQGKALAKGLAEGKDVMIDGEDTIELAKPDLTSTSATIDFVNQKKSLYLGMPESYLTGQQSEGMGDNGGKDQKAVERGLKNYYFSIVKPVIEGLFKVKTTFKSEDTELTSVALEALKTFDITSNDHLSGKNKTIVVNKLFGLDESEVGDKPEPVTQPPAGGGANPPPASPAASNPGKQ